MGLTVNTGKFKRQLLRASKRVDAEVIRAVNVTADAVIDDAKQRVPVDTGKLRDSLDQKTKRQRHGAESTLGSKVEYALLQHEDMSIPHDNGEARFLTNPLLHAGPKLKEELSKAIRRIK